MTDKEILKNLEAITKLDSYEQLNDVRFEGFSSLERRRSSPDGLDSNPDVPPKSKQNVRYLNKTEIIVSSKFF